MKLLFPAFFAAVIMVACNPVRTTNTASVSDTLVIIADEPVLKNALDSVSYVIGLSVGNFYSQQGFTQLSSELVARAVDDAISGREKLIGEDQANAILMNYLNRLQEEKASANIEEGRIFLEQNRERAGVTVTASGLQYEVLQQGTGRKPAATDTVVVHYIGWLINGSEFNNSYKMGTPISFPLNGVIRGWTEALQLMSEGSKYRFFIPHDLAYGLNDNGPIPGGSALIFDIELLEVKPRR